MKKISGVLLITVLISGVILPVSAQMTSGMADGNSSHSSSSYTPSSGSSSGKSYSTSGTSNSKQRRDEAMASHVNTVYKSLQQLSNSRMNEVNRKINNISFSNPFDKGSKPSQEIVKDWVKTKVQMEDKSEDNDYAKLSTKVNRVIATSSDNEPDGYFSVPGKNLQETSLAKYFSLAADTKVIYAQQDLLESLSTKPTNEGGAAQLEKLTDASLIVADKAVDDLLDKAEPTLGGHLKMIRDLGYKTTNLFSAQVNNFFECQSDCVEKSEAIYSSYKIDVANAFSGLIPGVDDAKGLIDMFARDTQAFQSYFKNLF